MASLSILGSDATYLAQPFLVVAYANALRTAATKAMVAAKD